MIRIEHLRKEYPTAVPLKDVNVEIHKGDVIRSNTYEAFFPLIATAVIYFLLTWILASLLKIVKLRFEPKRRSKEDILKGVKTCLSGDDWPGPSHACSQLCTF